MVSDLLSGGLLDGAKYVLEQLYADRQQQEALVEYMIARGYPANRLRQCSAKFAFP
jgi:hypothetical protein